MNANEILTTTEVRRHNGQCAYGEWMPLDEAPAAVIDEVVEAVIDASCRDMRREKPTENTADAGEVSVGGMTWVYRR